MKIITGLEKEPLFSPMTTDYHSGMIVEIPLYASALKGADTPDKLREFLSDYYAGERFIKVLPTEYAETEGALFSDACAGYDGMEIIVSGNDERVVLATRFDNLGKGASGAAVQCMNIVLGNNEDKGLNL